MPNRVIAFGDIHGCLSNLDALLNAIAPTAEDRLIFLGDLVDRGPDSAGVIKRVIALKHSHNVSVIKGNHEQMMLAAHSNPSRCSDWLLNGGEATLISYAIGRATLRDVPPEHWHFLENDLVDYVETDTHIFVHASAHPEMPMKDQPDYMLRWERCDNIAPHESGKTIVCGHTPQKSGRPMNRGYAICIDTGAGYGRVLTSLDVTTGRIWQVDADGKVSRSHISDYEEA